MSHPSMDESRTSTFDSAASAPAPVQMYAGRFQSSSSTHLADMNSSQSSLDPDAVQESQSNTEQSPEQLRGAGLTPYSTGPSPAIGQQPQSTTTTTNLSGLVCNVHKCTGKEPHALVGATTTILGDKLYVFGGRILSRRRPQLTSDLYELDLIRRHWTKVEATGDIPPPRYFHSVCTLGDTKLVCYGGMSPASAASNQNRSNTAQQQANSSESQPEVVVMSDIHIYDAPLHKWTYISTADTPQGRYAHCATILPSSATFSSANAPLSALHHNPSSTIPNQGTLGVVLDGTGGAEMIVVGGQDSANHYIEQISVFNLRSLRWTATNPLGRSCGAYRSVVAPLTTMSASRIGAGADDTSKSMDARDDSSSMLIYSNYNFLDVKLELQVRTSDGTMTEKPMHGQYSPPGLRFPNGGVLDNHFVVSGTYLTSSKQEYALWALDLRSLTWSRIDAGGSVFNQGSWNRGVLWSRRNTFVILGNRKRSLVDDYNHRRINFSDICMVELEAFGLYDNPRRASPTSAYPSVSAPVLPLSLLQKGATWSAGGRTHSAAASELGQKAMSLRELADMDLLSISGERIPVNSHILARRWGPFFTQLLREGTDASSSGLSNNTDTHLASDAATLRPNMNSQASRNSSITITPSLGHSSVTTSTLVSTRNGPTGSSAASLNSLHPSTNVTTTDTPNTYASLPPDSLHLSPSSRPRTLYLPHTLLTLQALVHYLYTSSLPSPPSHPTDPSQPPSHPDLCTPQILCSLLQLARPYRIDGLLEAIVERLHQVLDGRNAAAVFNAAAMAAGGGRGIGFAFGALYADLGASSAGEREVAAEPGSAETSFEIGKEDAGEPELQRSRSLSTSFPAAIIYTLGNPQIFKQAIRNLTKTKNLHNK
ncbi:Kelch-type beta propeller [Lasallia pustulata]|uniref:Kelch-type beta propeller n=1 Tax=Lasallia pustulata TaxID=136370 RepID=A0A1W5DA52_9LECA|nr:Kelch-type beta propeller [Lasallia pustulata]